jgi:hypothetical protein
MVLGYAGGSSGRHRTQHTTGVVAATSNRPCLSAACPAAVCLLHQTKLLPYFYVCEGCPSLCLNSEITFLHLLLLLLLPFSGCCAVNTLSGSGTEGDSERYEGYMP